MDASQKIERLLGEADRMNRALKRVKLEERVAYVYNPLEYARALYIQYLKLAVPGEKRVVLVGMNPGPWGMAQTGVPFGEVNFVRDWMMLDAATAAPKRMHPKRPVDGLACTRSEVSGSRLWGAVAKRYPAPKEFFRAHFVANWCPLLFLEESARNLPPDKLQKDTRDALAKICDRHLTSVIEVLSPTWVIGVGAFATVCAKRASSTLKTAPTLATLLHPSPASPKANRGWVGQARTALAEQGVPAFL